jgi:hypothetical protein
MGGNVFVKSGRVLTILENATTTGAGGWVFKDAPLSSIQAFGSTTSGSGATVVSIEATNNINGSYIVLGIISLTLGTTVTTDGFVVQAPWKYIRGNITSISGTNTTVTVEACV